MILQSQSKSGIKLKTKKSILVVTGRGLEEGV